MPIHTAQITLTANVKSEIVPPNTQPQEVFVHNHEHAANSVIFIGGDDVSTSNGMHARATETLRMQVGPNDSLYAISSSNAVMLHVLRITQD